MTKKKKNNGPGLCEPKEQEQIPLRQKNKLKRDEMSSALKAALMAVEKMHKNKRH